MNPAEVIDWKQWVDIVELENPSTFQRNFLTFLAISKRESKDEGWHKWERLVGRLSSCCLGWAHLPSKPKIEQICQVNKTLASSYLVVRGILVVIALFFLVFSDQIGLKTDHLTAFGGWEGSHYFSLGCVFSSLVCKYQTRQWKLDQVHLACRTQFWDL